MEGTNENKEQQMSDTAVITSEERAATPEVILPCPACGSSNCGCVVCTISADDLQSLHYNVECDGCYTSGPISDSDPDAIAAWNKLPRALTWAPELPKVAGTFFVRDIRYKEEAGLVHISSQQAARLLDKGPSPFIQYAGPIAPPIEP